MEKDKMAIYVDFDECLIHGFTNNDGKNPSYEEVKRNFETTWIPDDGNQYVIVIRHGAREFLQNLQKITPNVFILTAGMKNFQTRVAEAAGMLNLVKGLYGRDSKDVPTFPFSVLIDDLWIQCQNTYRKCVQMGVIDEETSQRVDHGPWNQEDTNRVVATIEKHYIQIKHFTGEDINDKGFEEVMPKIEPKLKAQEKELADYFQEKIKNTFINESIIKA